MTSPVEYRVHGAVLWRFLELIVDEGRRGTIFGVSIYFEPTGVGRISVNFATETIPDGFPDPMETEKETPNFRKPEYGT